MHFSMRKTRVLFTLFLPAVFIAGMCFFGGEMKDT